MKSERRHELQQNDLVRWLSGGYEQVQPYAKLILGLAIAVVTGIGIYMYASVQSAASSEQAWNDYLLIDAQGDDWIERLAQIASEHPETLAGKAALLRLADGQLTVGSDRLFSDRAGARKQLADAAKHYRDVLDTATDSLMQQRAAIGLAKAYEAQGEYDDLEKARKQYQYYFETWPDGPLAEHARHRYADLATSRTRGFYDWIARYEPPSLGATGLPEGVPDFETGTPPADEKKTDENDAATSPPLSNPGAASATPDGGNSSDSPQKAGGNNDDARPAIEPSAAPSGDAGTPAENQPQ